MQPTSTPVGTPQDPATAALATSAPVGTNAPVPVAPAASTAAVAGAPVALTAPTYNYADNVSSGQALQDLTNFQTSQKSPVDAYNEAVTSLGIPDVRTNVTNLRKQIADTTALLNALPDSVTGRTSGSLVTEAQRSRILGMESAPLTTALNQQSGNYNTETANLNELTGQAQNQASLVDQGQKNIEQALSTRYSGIKDAETTKAAAAAADRAYALQLQQIQAQQAQFQQQFAETQRQSNVSQANAKAASASSTASRHQAFGSDIQRALQAAVANAGAVTAGYRERVVNALIGQYGDILSPQEIRDQVGAVFTNGWEGQYLQGGTWNGTRYVMNGSNSSNPTVAAINKATGFKY